MTRGSARPRSAPAPVLALGGLLLTGSLAACSSPGQTTTLRSPDTTVHVAPDQHTVTAARPEPGESYAPFLAWRDRGTLAVTTFGSSTAGCFPVVLDETVDADGAYRAVVGREGASGQDCTDDWAAAQEWDLPVPDRLGTPAVIRLQLADEPDTAYEYPMGASRPG